MKNQPLSLFLLASLALPFALSAQVFNSGSSGALGNVVITTNTIWDMPNNGQFHVNRLTVNAGATLSFRKPASGLNPPVYILARSNVTVIGNISVDGKDGGPGLATSEGGPGGFSGGGSGTGGISAGYGHGPGRGLPGVGAAYGTTGGSEATYGNLLLFPLVGGSGGGGSDGNPGWSGGGGGGALLIASDTTIDLRGDLQARGGAGAVNRNGGGSGGGVRLVAPTILGSGRILVGGGQFDFNWGQAAGDGRARIDCLPQPIGISVVGNNNLLIDFNGNVRPVAWRIGKNPAIFPPAGQRLEIVHAAGTDVPPGTNSSVLVTLPAGSSSNQLVTLRAVNFTGAFDVRVDATPENGASYRTNFTWSVGASNDATANVTVRVPGNNPTRITAWAEVLY